MNKGVDDTFKADLKRFKKTFALSDSRIFVVNSAASGNTKYSLCADGVGVNAVSAALL